MEIFLENKRSKRHLTPARLPERGGEGEAMGPALCSLAAIASAPIRVIGG